MDDLRPIPHSDEAIEEALIPFVSHSPQIPRSVGGDLDLNIPRASRY